MPKFKPEPPTRSKATVSNLRLEFAPDKAAEVRNAAARYGVSMRAFCQQAIDYALANLDSAQGDRG